MENIIYVEASASISIYNKNKELIEELEWNWDHHIEYNSYYEDDLSSIDSYDVLCEVECYMWHKVNCDVKELYPECTFELYDISIHQVYQGEESIYF